MFSVGECASDGLLEILISERRRKEKFVADVEVRQLCGNMQKHCAVRTFGSCTHAKW